MGLSLFAAWAAGCGGDREPSGPLRFSEALARPMPRTAGTGATVAAAVPAAEPPPVFSQGLAPVRRAGAWGYLDTSGRMAIPARFDHAGSFRENRAPVSEGGRWGYLDVSGTLAIPPVWDWAGPFSDGRAPVARDGSLRFVDSAGAPVGELSFSEARGFSEGLAAVRIGEGDDGAWGFVDREGRLAIPPLFADVPRGFSGGLAAVAGADGRYGYIDAEGGFVLEPAYDAAGDFSEGLAPVARGERRGGRFRGEWWYVDAEGRRAFPGSFAWAGAFADGTAPVRLADGREARVTRDGVTHVLPSAGTPGDGAARRAEGRPPEPSPSP